MAHTRDSPSLGIEALAIEAREGSRDQSALEGIPRSASGATRGDRSSVAQTTAQHLQGLRKSLTPRRLGPGSMAGVERRGNSVHGNRAGACGVPRRGALCAEHQKAGPFPGNESVHDPAAEQATFGIQSRQKPQIQKSIHATDNDGPGRVELQGLDCELERVECGGAPRRHYPAVRRVDRDPGELAQMEGESLQPLRFGRRKLRQAQEQAHRRRAGASHERAQSRSPESQHPTGARRQRQHFQLGGQLGLQSILRNEPHPDRLEVVIQDS